jgi:hypothetical protein
MLKLLCALAILLSFLTDARAQFADWNEVTNGIRTDLLIDMAFTSPDIGFAVGDSNSAWKTVDGANQWVSIQLTDCSDCIYRFHRIHFFTPDRGYIWGTDLKKKSAIVLLTTDGGEHWNVADPKIADINYTSEDFGYKVWMWSDVEGSSTFQLECTTDMGKTWSTRFTQNFHYEEFQSDMTVKFGDSLNGIARENRINHTGSISVKRKFWLTKDGGKSWKSIIDTPLFVEPIRDGYWMGYGVGEILLSENRGEMFTTVMKTSKEPIKFFTGDDTGYWQDAYADIGPGQSIAHIFMNDSRPWLEGTSHAISGVKRIIPFINSTREESYLLAFDPDSSLVRVYKKDLIMEKDVRPVEQADLDFEIAGHELRLSSSNSLAVPVLFDMLGREQRVNATRTDARSWLIDLSSLPGGVYFISAGEETVKFIYEVK